MTAIYRNDFTIWLMKTAFWAIFTFFHWWFNSWLLLGI